MKYPFAQAKGYKAKKALLTQLSVSAKARAEALGKPTNEVLLADYALSFKDKNGKPVKDVVFHNFKEWGDLGYKVTKGRYFCIWSRPLQDGELTDNPDGGYGFTIANVWSNLDVVKMTKAEKAKRAKRFKN
jgi:hypothetical protein